MDRFLLQIRGLFCGQTLTTFLWTDSCYRFVDFSVDRLLLLFCGQTCWSCWQNLWTDFSDKFWADFVDKFVHICLTNFRDRFYRQNTNLDIEILLTEFVDKFVQPWQTFFRRTCWKEYQRFSFQQGGEICFCVGQTLFFFDKLVEKNIIDFLFNKGERGTRLTPRAKFQIFSLF